MKKKYVVMMRSFCVVGGGQQYLYQKAETLERAGFEVVGICGVGGKARISQLERFEKNCVDGMCYSPCFYNKRDQEKIVNEAIAIIDPHDDEEIYIESATASFALWAEMIAKKLNCRHVCFDFEEIFIHFTHSQCEFMDFKHKRKELLGITSNSLPLMFKGYKEVPPEEAYCYSAMCSNPVADVESPLVDEISKHQVVIGTIGRANKPYLIPCLEKIAEYINEHADTDFGVILIGGATETKYEEEAAAVFKNIKNATFYCTGMIFPIPKKLIMAVDAFVSSSGSATASARYGRPTVAVSANTHTGIGILDYTAKFSAIPEKELYLDIKDLLYDILDKKVCEHLPKIGLYDGPTYEERAEAEYKRQLMFVLENDTPLEYYDVSKVKKGGKTALVAFVARIFGRSFFLGVLKAVTNSKLKFLKG